MRSLLDAFSEVVCPHRFFHKISRIPMLLSGNGARGCKPEGRQSESPMDLVITIRELLHPGATAVWSTRPHGSDGLAKNDKDTVTVTQELP